MALLSEYAVTPDVFKSACYNSRDLWETQMRSLKEAFLSEGLVRDLRNGEWQELLSGNSYDEWVKDVILKHLKKNRRLVSSDPVLSHTPQTDREWCDEALVSNKITSLNGIIVSDAIERTYRKNSLVSSVNKLLFPNVKWWSPADSSLRLKRTIKDYKDALKLIFRHANSIMFIDPYIYPTQRNYADFVQLLEAAGNRPPQSPPLRVEIHCKIRKIRKKNGELKTKKAIHRIMENTFRDEFLPVLSQSNLEVKVFVWDDFHDRYLISDLVGIQMSNGFDTSTGPLKTIWSRIRRTDREAVEHDFDATIQDAKKYPKCQFNFTIP